MTDASPEDTNEKDLDEARPRGWLPGQERVQVGQSDKDMALLLATWAKLTRRSLEAVAVRYAGILRETAPEHEDLEAKLIWEASCTPRQQKVLRIADDFYLKKRQAAGRSEYAKAKKAAGLGAVRRYLRNRPDEEKAAAISAKHKRYRDNKKLAGAKPIDPQVADELDDLLAALPDLGHQRASKEEMASMSPEEIDARRKLQQAADSKRYRDKKRWMKCE
ncbi:MAG: hypothetical protein H7245_09170 [Candidatus Saccharibacteria bacterium]|nr:hypothetical protein [Pseudorhodobacter sp.]